MAQIEFDEGGGTFSYFLVLLYGLFVLILTYVLWPRNTTGRTTPSTPIEREREMEILWI
jgi:heme/copper-type cytochrome/quinol oxidase subunit 2